MPDEKFTTIEQHWAHYLERDIPAHAEAFQVASMKRAFAAGAMSGLALTVDAMTSKKPALAVRTLTDCVVKLIKT